MVFYNRVIIKKTQNHKINVRSEAERVIDHNLPICHPLTEVMGVQHYRPYEALLLGSHPSLVVLLYVERECKPSNKCTTDCCARHESMRTYFFYACS